MQRIQLKDRSFSVEALPSETGLIVELMDLCSNEDATFEMYATSIRRDAALTAQFIQIANSPLYRQWNEVTDLKRMLIVLGMKNVRKIIITSAVQQFFTSLAQDNDMLVHRLWLRSLVCAHLAERLAHKTGYAKNDEAYLAGLLHQIGIFLILANYKDNYRDLLCRYDTTADFSELERENYGIDHCEVGASLIESWQLDSLLADAVMFQFAPPEQLTNSPTLLKITAVARSLSSSLRAEAGEEDIEKTETLLQLSQDTTLECLAGALDDSRKILSQLGFNFTDETEFSEAISQNETEKLLRLQKVEISERVKNIALTHCTVAGENQNHESLVKELRVNFELLFKQRKLLFIRHRSGATDLTVFNDLGKAKLDDVSFAIADRNSSVIKSFNQRQTADIHLNNVSLNDRQLLRVLDAEAACCLPVTTSEDIYGVLVLGCQEKQLSAIKEKLPLMQMLLAEMAESYAQLSLAEPPSGSISLTDYGKIVHEVKNPLTIINNYLYILGRKLDKNHHANEEIDFIKEEIARISEILSSAKNDTSGKNDEPLSNVNTLLKELDSFFEKSLYPEKAIQSDLLLDDAIPALLLPGPKLRQVFLNIIKNAVETLPQSGNLQITTRDNCFLDGTQFVEISIRDNGPGIPPEILKNLFRPVQSTKKGHSGLGLAIVGDLIKEISGTISCYSSPTAGTEFKILLPRSTPE